MTRCRSWLGGLPADYSKLPPRLPELGPPLPGDLGPAIVNSQQPVTPGYAPPSHDPEDALRNEADAAAASSVFFRSGGQGQAAATVAQRSEEHTSELQSLMRISYAVLCLQKQNNTLK